MFKKIINKILGVKEYVQPWEFKHDVYLKLNNLEVNTETPVRIVYVKGYTGKKSDKILIKDVSGITNVGYHKLLEKTTNKLSKNSYAYRLIKHQLNLNRKRIWGENVNNTVIKYGKKRYVNAIIKNSTVIRGDDISKESKKKSNSIKISKITGLNPRSFNLKNVLSIKIGHNTFKNKSLINKIR